MDEIIVPINPHLKKLIKHSPDLNINCPLRVGLSIVCLNSIISFLIEFKVTLETNKNTRAISKNGKMLMGDVPTWKNKRITEFRFLNV